MFKLLDHPDDTIKHNILCWLIRTMEEQDSEAFVLMAKNSCMSQYVRKEAIEKFQEYLRQKEAGEYNLFAMPLYAHIPNLKDIVKPLK